MNLLAWFQSLQKTAMAQDIAVSFLIGFSIAAVKQLAPLVDPTSFGASLFHITQAARNQLWLYNFFDSSFTSAIGVSIGLKVKSAFDSFKSTTTTTMLQFPPASTTTQQK